MHNNVQLFAMLLQKGWLKVMAGVAWAFLGTFTLVNKTNKVQQISCHRVLTALVLFSLQLLSASVHFIAAKHTTPFKGYVDNINFRLVPYHFFTSCHISVSVCIYFHYVSDWFSVTFSFFMTHIFVIFLKAMSVSETWYAIKDHGTNYCNLYNLMEGTTKPQHGAETSGRIHFPLHSSICSL